MSSKYIVFDLDDTLAYEIDYLKSAYREIATKLGGDALYNEMIEMYERGENVFEYLSVNYDTSLSDLLSIYRNHFPNIVLIDGAKEVLEYCKANKYKIGLISDGRSVTQRNKLKALGIESLFNNIVISEEFGSEKPNKNNYLNFTDDSIDSYYYIADNTKKDFITPNKLGWTTVCLIDSGNNIHPQSFEVEDDFLPQHKVNSLLEVIKIIEKD